MHPTPLRSTRSASTLRSPVTLVARALPVALCLACLLGAGGAHAETWTLRAIEDFPVIDAGEVPYYRETARDALAIDAANVAFRDRPARATAPHPGPGGTFDLVLTTLAEVDGETTYRVLVDGVRVAEATNPRVPDEFAVRTFEFDDVEIPDGATLGVESAAVSNELVPENGEFAFARGRWTSLAIATVAAEGSTADAAELSVALAGPGSEVRVGDRLVVGVAIANAATADVVATAPAVTLELPATLGFVSGEGCAAADDGAVRCALAELPPGADDSLSLELEALGAGKATVIATVSADQGDGAPGNDRAELDIEVRVAEGVDASGGEAPDPAPSGPVEPTDPDGSDGPEDGTEDGTGNGTGDDTDGDGRNVRDGSGGGGATWLTLPLLLIGTGLRRALPGAPA